MREEEDEEAETGAGETRGRGEVLMLPLLLLPLLEVDTMESERERRGGGTFVIRRGGDAIEERGRGGVVVREPDMPPRSRRSTVVAGTT
jgi:hypothetical protein